MAGNGKRNFVLWPIAAIENQAAETARLYGLIERVEAQLARIEEKWPLLDDACDLLMTVSAIREAGAVDEAVSIIDRARKILAEGKEADRG